MADEEEKQEEVQDEGDIDLNEDENKVDKRVRKLSEKVKLTSQERDELAQAKQKAEGERDAAKKEMEFYASFSDATDKYPAAKEFKDKIKEKVLSGYSVEDAAVAVLAKEGKLTAPAPARANPAGGSAVNPAMQGETKSLQEMNREEKRAEVLKAMERGDISIS